MSDQGKLHTQYFSILDAQPNITKQLWQKDANEIWQQIKRKEKNYYEVMAQLQMRAQEHKLKMMKFWTGKKMNKALTVPKQPDNTNKLDIAGTTAEPGPSGACGGEPSPAPADETPPVSQHVTPSQTAAKDELAKVNSRIASINITKRHIELSCELKNELKTLEKKKNDLEKKMKRLVSDQRSQQKLRDKRKQALSEIIAADNSASKKSSIFGK